MANVRFDRRGSGKTRVRMSLNVKPAMDAVNEGAWE
jgi:hypothetical protein